MAIESVEDVSLTEIPNFKGGVIAAGKKVTTIWVEVYLVHLGGVGVVVLD